jgi:hypothetical protein
LAPIKGAVRIQREIGFAGRAQKWSAVEMVEENWVRFPLFFFSGKCRARTFRPHFPASTRSTNAAQSPV